MLLPLQLQAWTETREPFAQVDPEHISIVGLFATQANTQKSVYRFHYMRVARMPLLARPFKLDRSAKSQESIAVVISATSLHDARTESALLTAFPKDVFTHIEK